MEKNVAVNVSGQGNIVNVAEYMSNVTNHVNQNLGRSGCQPAAVMRENQADCKSVRQDASAGPMWTLTAPSGFRGLPRMKRYECTCVTCRTGVKTVQRTS